MFSCQSWPFAKASRKTFSTRAFNRAPAKPLILPHAGFWLNLHFRSAREVPVRGIVPRCPCVAAIMGVEIGYSGPPTGPLKTPS